MVPLVALVLLVSSCASSVDAPPVVVPAEPQRATVEWIERYPDAGPALVFTTKEIAVTSDGWEAEVAIENETAVAWELAADPIAVQQGFGVMLFETGDLAELERRNRDGDMPGLRAARSFTPPLPRVLEPGQSWHGRIAAPGALAAGRYVRVVFGTLTASGDPPKGLPSSVVWITDSAHRLR